LVTGRDVNQPSRVGDAQFSRQSRSVVPVENAPMLILDDWHKHAEALDAEAQRILDGFWQRVEQLKRLSGRAQRDKVTWLEVWWRHRCRPPLPPQSPRGPSRRLWRFRAFCGQCSWLRAQRFAAQLGDELLKVSHSYQPPIADAYGGQLTPLNEAICHRAADAEGLSSLRHRHQEPARYAVGKACSNAGWLTP